MSDTDSNGTEWCWDHEDCPRDHCDGELQQQDRLNVMCLECETVFTHQKDDDEHRLIHDCEFVARKSRAKTDGGQVEDGTERFEKVTRREIHRCKDCGEFELEKKFSGVAGTTGEEEYDRIEAPDQCPVCGEEIEREVVA